MGGGRKPKKGQNETGGAEWGERTHLKKRGTERGDRGRNTTRETREREREEEGAKRVTSSRAASAHGAGRSCGKVNSTGEFLSDFSHLQPSQETIKMTALDLTVW